MSEQNPRWGAPRIHGELLKLGIEISQTTVAKYMAKPRRPPSQTWRTFLANHVHQIVAADFFVVPTAMYRLLFVLVILSHDRRRVVHTAVTAHPTAAWTAQQFREAFPWDQAPRYLIRDRDRAFQGVSAIVGTVGTEEVLTAPRSPWQNAYAERFIGSIRRECLDHVIVLNAAGLRTILKSYVSYYMTSRTHLSLEKDSPTSRPVMPPAHGRVIAVPQVGGLHHRYRSLRRIDRCSVAPSGRSVLGGTRRQRRRRSFEGQRPRPDLSSYDRRVARVAMATHGPVAHRDLRLQSQRDRTLRRPTRSATVSANQVSGRDSHP
jgi:transposase InsO family protein